jgi:hypothetical protein
MHKLRVYLMKANMTFEGTTAEVCNQMNSDLRSLSQTTMRQMIIR